MPPVGALRWKPPQPVASWTGVRTATEFGNRCVQTNVFEDMIFPDPGPSEDCLYPNLWIPVVHSETPLPVMVWIYGGGYRAGATSEPRQDGSNLSQKGVLVVSMNYGSGFSDSSPIRNGRANPVTTLQGTTGCWISSLRPNG